jgi:hypothetical protein
MSRKTATKEQLVEAICKYKTPQQVATVLGYANTNSLKYALHCNFGTGSFEELKARFRKKQVNPLRAYMYELAKTEDMRAFSKQFENPIAYCNLETGEHFCRIDEVWAREGLS